MSSHTVYTYIVAWISISVNLIRGMVRGKGFVRLVPTLVFLETFLDMLLWHHASPSTLYRVAQTPDLVACSSWLQYQHKWMTTQTRVLIVEKFYAIANITVYFGGIGRGRECTPPMNHCCPPPTILKKYQNSVMYSRQLMPLHYVYCNCQYTPSIELVVRQTICKTN